MYKHNYMQNKHSYEAVQSSTLRETDSKKLFSSLEIAQLTVQRLPSEHCETSWKDLMASFTLSHYNRNIQWP